MSVIVCVYRWESDLASRVEVDADAFPEDQLHVSRVAELYHGSYRQVHTLLRPHPASAQLGRLMNRGVPGRFCLHLDTHKQRQI